MADIGDFSLDTLKITVLPVLQARIVQMEKEIRRSYKQLAQSNEQLTEAHMLVATLAINQDTQPRAEESEIPV